MIVVPEIVPSVLCVLWYIVLACVHAGLGVQTMCVHADCVRREILCAVG